MPTVLRSCDGFRASSNAHTARFLQYLRYSRALASLLPALLASGAFTLAAIAMLREMHVGMSRLFAGTWLETWLTCWAFAYPLTYLAVLLLRRQGASKMTAAPRTAHRRMPS